MSGLLKSSIGRKVAMALSGLFLVVFLTQHFVINLASVLSPDTFNTWSHFMGTNGLVQAGLQPVLIFGVFFHFIMGIRLELQNRNARPVKYVSYKGSANANWMSRNMIITGLVVLAFLGLHFYDFFIPELTHKYIDGDMSGLLDPNNPALGYKYHPETVHKFEQPWRVGLYVVSFVLLMLHLLHGFQSSLQSIGFNNKYSKALKVVTKGWAIIIPLGFIFIALYHHLNQLAH
jgi:succinate dehydrogenase / fumarate reductase cytochrome b subunit